ncbi:unnamed protein product [Meloidogyne enterolobii]|uniref:Uncharacterized protein n=1 Tax=Meloidogyne enterolobii TaxID=390850 RepID=A0ACB0ZB93_MELEN
MVVQNQGQTQHNPYLGKNYNLKNMLYHLTLFKGLQHSHQPVQASWSHQQLPIVPYYNPPQNQNYFG